MEKKTETEKIESMTIAEMLDYAKKNKIAITDKNAKKDDIKAEVLAGIKDNQKIEGEKEIIEDKTKQELVDYAEEKDIDIESKYDKKDVIKEQIVDAIEDKESSPVLTDEPDETKEKDLGDSSEEKEKDETEIETISNETAISDIKSIRIEIDGAYKKVSVFLGNRSTCATDLFNAKAWLGKALAQLGTKNPYKKANTKQEIPPTQDVSDINIREFNLLGRLEKVNALRDEIELLVDQVESLNFEGLDVKNGRLLAIAKTQSYVHLCEAKFELGNQLAIIREN